MPETPQISNPDQPVLAAVTAAYARYAAQSQAWVTRYTQQGGKVHCGSGCFSCCNLPIRVSLAEALLTASALSDAQHRAMRDHALAVMSNARAATSWNEYFQRHRLKVGYCPLLDATTGACTAYQWRPARCRDTFSAFNSRYCRAGALEGLNRRERLEYARLVKANQVTDGVTHYIAPLEDMGEAIWDAAAGAMRAVWGVEVWGDFWVLTTLAEDATFMSAIRGAQAKRALRRAKSLGLWHTEIVEINT